MSRKRVWWASEPPGHCHSLEGPRGPKLGVGFVHIRNRRNHGVG